MKTPTTAAVKSHRAGFTLMEMLVSLAFMALVVPVVVQGLKLAALAGEVSQRKALAMRVAERVLNETIVTGRWNQLGQGDEKTGVITLHWAIRSEPWSALNGAVNVSTPGGVNQSVVSANNLHLLTVDVTFPAQGQTYGVHLSTVADVSKQISTSLPPTQ